MWWVHLSPPHSGGRGRKAVGYIARLCLKTQQPNGTNKENKGWGCAWHTALAFCAQGSGLCPQHGGWGRKEGAGGRDGVKTINDDGDGWGEWAWVSAEGTAEPEWGGRGVGEGTGCSWRGQKSGHHCRQGKAHGGQMSSRVKWRAGPQVERGGGTWRQQTRTEGR